MVVALESSFYHSGKVAPVLAGFVDGNTERGQSWQIHQQVVDQVTETIAHLLANNCAQSNPVNATQWVIGNDGVEFLVVGLGQVLQTTDVQGRLSI